MHVTLQGAEVGSQNTEQTIINIVSTTYVTQTCTGVGDGREGEEVGSLLGEADKVTFEIQPRVHARDERESGPPSIVNQF